MAIATLTLELQIMLVAGYLAYSLTAVGKGVSHKTEDIIFRALVFGLIARAISAVFLPEVVEDDTVGKTLAVQGVPTVVIGLLLAGIWRRIGQTWFVALMRWASIYRDDHEATVIASIGSTNAKWNYVQVQLKSGITLEADYTKINPTLLPLKGITLNTDGIALYATGKIDSDNTRVVFDSHDVALGSTISYIPFSEIKQLDVTWK